MTHAQSQHFIDQLNWDKSPLIPVVVQSYCDNAVLMLGFMDQEALRLSLETKVVHYFSRTKGRIWKKGEKSGHIQKIIEIFLDCDNDTLLFKVEQTGSVCHTGRETCFFQKLDFANASLESLGTPLDLSEHYDVIDTLYHILQAKKNQDPKQSYTASLYAKGENTIGKKIIEEAGELSFAIKDNDPNQIIYECADTIYHILVGLSYKNISPDRVRSELKRRFAFSGIEEKRRRE
ncbi:bifunctional phosphoribosyl-AMP cyclohydrolase/phosphoribosyl-ATP pyrophosphatase [Helicobacter sp. 12S02634-8]|uniref:bifunctional phosphoribosyl-AMP cyclohydrolase/phosphoribosyl-ATP diphosphatase HisIE n=1 Tax=Helicobacter sp. 12S02634-8 TaxID=1476199 RepID=UPI000BA6A3C7|nr:bifunctional phosphoribosyl-AMP cyclohydrolase/phosphoribosyl-ATP diphosphatase HisIE [Helicobacter sp. 12S02634-8]PAF47802.1 bifunctional phosphoribosyl-AMP cyclohydrolase/phosphoribosyl-ATP pyrophosphatase [Helicobacter sp. 12S02634-8]